MFTSSLGSPRLCSVIFDKSCYRENALEKFWLKDVNFFLQNFKRINVDQIRLLVSNQIPSFEVVDEA